MVPTILKKIYRRISYKPRKTKAELFLDVCKEWGIYIPESLDLSLKDVLVPHHLTVSQFAKRLEAGKRVLDMGCGLGVLSAIAFMNGAEEVVAVDINPKAVEEAKKLLPQAQVISSDLFENIKGEFDTIIFNAPWLDGFITKPIEYAWIDANDVAGRFFEQAGNYLKKEGFVWLQYADAFAQKHKRLYTLIKENNFEIAKSWHHTRWGPAVERFIKVFLYKIKLKTING